jgi:hypothetical protein
MHRKLVRFQDSGFVVGITGILLMESQGFGEWFLE